MFPQRADLKLKMAMGWITERDCRMARWRFRRAYLSDSGPPERAVPRRGLFELD
jgi:hypothetical protein